MKFTALEVKVGDSFLLEYKDSLGEKKRILVDGGTDVDVVIEKNNPGISEKFIDLIICTHYDKDHISGILNLLEKGYHFSEMWLPDKMCEVVNQVSNNCVFQVIKDVFYATMIHIHIEYLNSFSERPDNYEEKNGYTKEKLAAALEYGMSLTEKYLCSSLEEFDCLKEYDKRYEYKEKIKILEHIKEENKKKGNNQIFTDLFGEMLDLIIKMCKLKTISGIIRWMKYEDRYVATRPSKSFPVLAMNSSENISKVIYFSTKQFLLEFYNDNNNRNHESLVFMYEEEGMPNILFSGDSDYYWLWKNKKSVELEKSSIVTAPHHGSETGKAAYDTNVIYSCSSTGKTNTDIIFVRSDSPGTSGYKLRPCTAYIKMDSKYCRFCGKNKRIILEYDDESKNFNEINGNSMYSNVQCVRKHL